MQENNDWYAKTSSVQTMKTWAKRPEAPRDLPEPFVTFFSSDASETFPTDAVFLPGDKTLRPQDIAFRSRLLGLDQKALTLWEERGRQIEKLQFPLSEIRWIQRGVVLLSSWLEVSSDTHAARLPFASVNEILIDPFLLRLRQAVAPPGECDEETWERSRDNLDRLGPLHFKFMSYGRRLLRRGDCVRAVAYQEERRVGWRKFVTPFLMILTEKEFLIIRDPEHIRRGRQGLYGGIFSFAPLTQIQSLTWESLNGTGGRDKGEFRLGWKAGGQLVWETSGVQKELSALVEAFNSR
ncbi:MAG: hypothetical protein HKM05_01850 [Spirochaetales bacterium]|nr:hypothetical protein [Spirochaetales bacterium]